MLPTVPPNFNGLADYAHHLSLNWPDPSQSWRVLALRVPADAELHWENATIQPFAPDSEGLYRSLIQSGSDTVILHYVGYGYAKRGAPLWMAPALRKWKRETQGTLVIVFHELFAVGPVWKSAFWLSKVQQFIVKDLVRLADYWLTSCSKYEGELLRDFGASRSKGALLPVGSNIAPVGPRPGRAQAGEPDAKYRIAVFGLPSTRLDALRKHVSLLTALQAEGKLRGLMLIGSSPNPEVDASIRSLVSEVGASEIAEFSQDLTEGQVSEKLLQCDLGLVATQPQMVGKSGVYAAYCAHGIRPVLPGDTSLDAAFFARPFPEVSWERIAGHLASAISALERGSGAQSS